MKNVWIAMLYVSDTSSAMTPAHVYFDKTSADNEVKNSHFGGWVKESKLVQN
jgi:hypothetical protein